MQFIRQTALALGLVSGLTCNAEAASVAGTATVDKDFAHSVWNWERIGEAHIYWDIFTRDGMLVVCGGFATRGASRTWKLTKVALRDSVVTLNGKSIISNLNFFAPLTEGGKELDFTGSQTNCKVTSTPVPAKGADEEFNLKSRKDAYRG